MSDREWASNGPGLFQWRLLMDSLEGRVGVQGEGRDARRRKLLFTASVIAVMPTGIVWAAIYFAYGEHVAAVIPISYLPITFVNLAVLLRLRRFELFRNVQQLQILVLPFALQLALGGFVPASAVIMWSFIAVLLALLYGASRAAVGWFVAYALEVVAAAALQPLLRDHNPLPPALVVTFFALNIATVALILFAVLLSFVTDRQKLRALELAFLNQELALRQSEKMATLGTLVAGVAHELNNPAAATSRASQQLRDAIDNFESAHAGAEAAPLTAEGREVLHDFEQSARAAAGASGNLGALERSDRETAIEQWLDAHGVAEGWELAPLLAEQRVDLPALSHLGDVLDEDGLRAVLPRAARAFLVYRLVQEIGDASGRISEIVAALKSYSFLDQAPVQFIDLREGLDTTLRILRSKLKEGVEVHRDYAADLPLVPAHGSELNQVWTNLLDNAVDAVDGSGTVTIRTRRDGDWAVIDIEDDGPGIPQAVRTRIFDPFFTTKEPGSGTGLGLSASHSIVTEKHNGKISVESQPGFTRFRVSLPLEAQSASPGSLERRQPPRPAVA